ncbi:MAG: hypothetical protein ACU841_03140 [Gammaproteobacteria bacterium]
MSRLIAVALGGACGSVRRFLAPLGVHQWLGTDFPYSTLSGLYVIPHPTEHGHSFEGHLNLSRVSWQLTASSAFRCFDG